MREICYKCLRSKENCFCRFLNPFDSGIKFVILMHPKEAKRQRTGTGRIAAAGIFGRRDFGRNRFFKKCSALRTSFGRKIFSSFALSRKRRARRKIHAFGGKMRRKNSACNHHRFYLVLFKKNVAFERKRRFSSKNHVF